MLSILFRVFKRVVEPYCGPITCGVALLSLPDPCSLFQVLGLSPFHFIIIFIITIIIINVIIITIISISFYLLTVFQVN